MRRRRAGGDAAPAGRRRNAPPATRAAPGPPPGGTTVPCQELADGGPVAACPRPWKESVDPERTPRASSRRQGKTGRQKARSGADKTLRWRAERRHTFARRCALTGNDAPPGAPSTSLYAGAERGIYGVPGAAREIRGEWRLVFLADAALSSARQYDGRKKWKSTCQMSWPKCATPSYFTKKALVSNDVPALQCRCSATTPRTIRYERRLKFSTVERRGIKAFRRRALAGGARAHAVPAHGHHHFSGREFAVGLDCLYERPSPRPARPDRQMQTWVKFPEAGGWSRARQPH